MELDTKRLILRPIEEADSDLLYPLINNLDVAIHMLNIPNPYPDGMLLSWIRATRESMEHNERLDLTIILKATGAPIGVCGINQINWEHMNAEIGYWLGQPYWGNGYMTEAVVNMLDYGFDDYDFYRMYARCLMSNPASARVLEKSGMKFEGCARGEVYKDGKYLDVLHFGLIKPEFIFED